MNTKKSKLSRNIGIMLLILGTIGFMISLGIMMSEQTQIFVQVSSPNFKQVPLNNTNSSGLTAIASAILIIGGSKLIQEYTKT